MSSVTLVRIEGTQLGRNLAKHDVGVRRADHLAGDDEVLGAHRARDVVGKPRVPWPPEPGDCDHGVDQGGLQEPHDRERPPTQRRNRQEDVRDAHDDGLGPAAVVAGQQAEHDAERHCDPEHDPHRERAIYETRRRSGTGNRGPPRRSRASSAPSGGRSELAKSTREPACSGNGVTKGAKMASSVTASTMAAPVTDSGLRLKRYHARVRKIAVTASMVIARPVARADSDTPPPDR